MSQHDDQEHPPSSPRGHHRHLLLAVGAVALATGATAGGVLGGTNSTSGDTTTGDTTTAAASMALSAGQIAASTDPALADIVSTDGDQNATSAGTGIVLTSDGLVLTNNHVIEGATAIEVTDIGNGRAYTATAVGYDAADDVAVIRLLGASGLTTARLGDSASVRAGDAVVALGNAGGRGGAPSVATGKVTAVDESVTATDALANASEQLTGTIQSNAAIQPGDSGGSLVNAYGQVIGVDTAASAGSRRPSGKTVEQAYAIPIDHALSIARQIDSGKGTPGIHLGATGFLGVKTESAGTGDEGPGDEADGYRAGAPGVDIAGTLPGSPAANAGLANGDVITAIDGQSVGAAAGISQALDPLRPGSSVSISWVDPYGQSHAAIVTLAVGPAA